MGICENLHFRNALFIGTWKSAKVGDNLPNPVNSCSLIRSEEGRLKGRLVAECRRNQIIEEAQHAHTRGELLFITTGNK